MTHLSMMATALPHHYVFGALRLFDGVILEGSLQDICGSIGLLFSPTPPTPETMQSFKQFVEGVGLVIDAAGVLVIVVGLLFAAGRFFFAARREADPYRRLRQDMGRGILLGLELLVAADIIRTVAVDPTLENVSVLGLIVLIRTFLSMALQVELEGRWPWQEPDTRSPRIPAEQSEQRSSRAP